jgi:hypothetical protein
MKTKTILLTLLLFCTIGVQAADKTWHLVTDKGVAIELSSISYLLAASEESFDIVCTDGTTVSGVTSVKLEERESTSIESAKTTESTFSKKVDGEIIISNAKANTMAQVLSLSGITLISQTLTSGQNVINVSMLLSGTYILKVGETSIKFIKK